MAVECSDCGKQWQKRKDNLKMWSGKCRNCSQKSIAEKIFVQRLCSIIGCGQLYYASGYCCLHYQRWKKFGNPHHCTFRVLSLNRPGELTQHLLEHRHVTEAGCWEWERHKSSSGYGNQIVDGKSFPVHRLIAHLYLQMEINEDILVCHSCDNPPCFNPAHLFLGSPKDNIEDMFLKNRANKARGERNGTSKLKEEQVMDVHKQLKDGLSQREIAKQLGISQSAISLIKRRKNWSHLAEEKKIIKKPA